MQALLIRHGLTDAVGHHLAGTAPGVHLNAAGREQVERLGARLAPLPLDAVVSSPLERARETAAPIAAAHRLDVEIAPALAEFEVAEWTGRTFASLDTDEAWQAFNRVRSIARPPGGESMLDVQQRAVGVLFDLQRQHPSGTVAVVSHGDVIRAVLLFALGMPLDFYDRLDVAPASVSIVELTTAAPRVRLMNGGTLPGDA